MLISKQTGNIIYKVDETTDKIIFHHAQDVNPILEYTQFKRGNSNNGFSIKSRLM